MSDGAANLRTVIQLRVCSVHVLGFHFFTADMNTQENQKRNRRLTHFVYFFIMLFIPK